MRDLNDFSVAEFFIWLRDYSEECEDDEFSLIQDFMVTYGTKFFEFWNPVVIEDDFLWL